MYCNMNNFRNEDKPINCFVTGSRLRVLLPPHLRSGRQGAELASRVLNIDCPTTVVPNFSMLSFFHYQNVNILEPITQMFFPQNFTCLRLLLTGLCNYPLLLTGLCYYPLLPELARILESAKNVITLQRATASGYRYSIIFFHDQPTLMNSLLAYP